MLKSYILNTDGNVQIARHFKVKEFACKDGSQVVFIDEYLYTILDILHVIVTGKQIGRAHV